MRSMKGGKNNKLIKIAGAVIVLLVIAAGIYFWKDKDVKPEVKVEDKTTQEAITDPVQGVAEGINIKVSAPTVNSKISSPMKVVGEAKGWYSEGSFPIKLVDEKGTVIAKGEAKAKGEWMKDAYVPFEAELKFESGESKKGDIIFEKSNSSGKPENAGSFSFGVLFVK